MSGKPLKIGIAHFTGCSGCQLMLLNCEAELALLAERVVCLDASMLTSTRNERERFDLLLVEGSISSPAEQARLRELRERCQLLVAMGACALTGGINHFTSPARPAACTQVYGPVAERVETFPPQPVEAFVAVDARIPGCPPERHDFLDLFGALACGGQPAIRDIPVCMECRSREIRCLLEVDQLPCFGPVTIGGCNARCPSCGVPCEGCRGEVPEANRDELFRLLQEAKLSEAEIRSRSGRFSGGKHD